MSVFSLTIFYDVFLTGNKETLLTRPRELGLDVRDELLKFHNKFYSSNIMSLAVLGKGEGGSW